MRLRSWILLAGIVPFASQAHAHVGSPDVYVESQAGPYKLFVVVRPPMVIPGVADVEVHLHHDRETRDAFTGKIREYCNRLTQDHGLLRQHDGRTVFGFIHGNWALDNSRPDGRYCGLNNEITLLRNLGCYADFTMPSGSSPTQSRTVNTTGDYSGVSSKFSLQYQFDDGPMLYGLYSDGFRPGGVNTTNFVGIKPQRTTFDPDRLINFEFGAKGITSNALSPGFFATETNEKMIASSNGEKHRERCPAKRWADPKEIAGAAIFLASPAASYVNGHTLVVDGGVSATYLS